ncbi:hypothetical protein SO694_00005464 [Aureococcus anophagefferens]|uniref:Uncharacterized protein n=1 Tax=Aureococcus anophagefferens TaxID=44056 RepID=A0ABR1G9Z4_AURAN
MNGKAVVVELFERGEIAQRSYEQAIRPYNLGSVGARPAHQGARHRRRRAAPRRRRRRHRAAGLGGRGPAAAAAPKRGRAAPRRRRQPSRHAVAADAAGAAPAADAPSPPWNASTALATAGPAAAAAPQTRRRARRAPGARAAPLRSGEAEPPPRGPRGRAGDEAPRPRRRRVAVAGGRAGSPAPKSSAEDRSCAPRARSTPAPPLPRRGRSATEEVAERARLRACARDALVAFGAALKADFLPQQITSERVDGIADLDGGRWRHYSARPSAAAPAPRGPRTLRAVAARRAFATTSTADAFKTPRKKASALLADLKREELERRRTPLPDFKAGDSIEMDILVDVDATKPQKRRVPLYSPLVKGVTLLQKAFLTKGKKRVKRAKLFYLVDQGKNFKAP